MGRKMVSCVRFGVDVMSDDWSAALAASFGESDARKLPSRAPSGVREQLLSHHTSIPSLFQTFAEARGLYGLWPLQLISSKSFQFQKVSCNSRLEPPYAGGVAGTSTVIPCLSSNDTEASTVDWHSDICKSMLSATRSRGLNIPRWTLPAIRPRLPTCDASQSSPHS